MASPTKGALVSIFSPEAIERITGARAQNGRQDGRAAWASEQQPSSVWSPEATLAFEPPRGYFVAGRPLAPVAPPESTTGRRWDYPTSINLNYTPRGEAGQNAIGFRTLRHMAEPAEGGLDLLRLAIETRKDQMSAQRWKLRGKNKNDDGGADGRKVEEWLAKPDGVHTFRQWMRMLLEDHLVIDAPAIYLSAATLRGEERPLFEPVDGATLKLLILARDGRTPMPPLPAYQQIIKGTPAQDYTLDELGYYPYNVRTNRLYGMSRVEQVLATINLALNRQLSQLSYYTQGTVPDGFMELPKEWSMEAIQKFTEWFNSEMSGQTGERRKMRFVPGDAKYVATKTEILKDATDEWLARIICYCFSLSPQALVKEMNRATAQTNQQSAQQEGLEPMKLWFSDVMDDLLDRAGFPNLRWGWADEEIVDPKVKAEVIMSYYGGATGGAAKIATLAESREAAGMPPATPDQLKELQPAPEPPPTGGAIGDGTPPKNAPPNGAANGNGKKKAPAAGDQGTTTKVLGDGSARRLPSLRTFGYRSPWRF